MHNVDGQLATYHPLLATVHANHSISAARHVLPEAPVNAAVGKLILFSFMSYFLIYNWKILLIQNILRLLELRWILQYYLSYNDQCDELTWIVCYTCICHTTPFC